MNRFVVEHREIPVRRTMTHSMIISMNEMKIEEHEVQWNKVREVVTLKYNN